MNNCFYPAIFHNAEEGGFWITFPDFPEIITQGDTTEEAYKMASNALGLCIDEKLKCGEELPAASSINDCVKEPGSFPCLIEFDLMQYRRTHNTKSVKKTLSIPEWLNEAAVAQNINFSQVLQDALLHKIGML